MKYLNQLYRLLFQRDYKKLEHFLLPVQQKHFLQSNEHYTENTHPFYFAAVDYFKEKDVKVHYNGLTIGGVLFECPLDNARRKALTSRILHVLDDKEDLYLVPFNKCHKHTEE